MTYIRNQLRALQDTTSKHSTTEPGSISTQLDSHNQQVSYACPVVNKSPSREKGNGSITNNTFPPDKPKDYMNNNNHLSDNRKFRLVVYCLNECPTGTPRHTRFLQDNKSVGAVLSSIDELITDQSIKACLYT